MIRVGPAGWSYADWEGRVYPRPKPRGFHPLRFLSRYVSCVEVNASFYAMPRAEHVRRWVQAVEDQSEFRFIAKLHRDFTHGGDLAGERARAAAQAFLAGLEPLQEAGRLAAILVQFPLSFRPDSRGLWRLETIAELLQPVPLALEVRHRSWFEPGHIGALADLGYSVAHIDLPASEDHPPAWHAPTGPLGYLRLHGRNRQAWFDRQAGRDQRYDYLYPPGELQGLVTKARRLAAARPETYVVTNNHFAGNALVNALEILAGIQERPVRAPAEWLRTWPRLAGLSHGEGQQTLF